MSDELEILPSKIPKAHGEPMAQLIYDAQRDFTEELLIPILNKKFSEADQRTDSKIGEQRHYYESEQHHQLDVIKGMDAQMRETWHSVYETTKELRDETKDSRAAREQLSRVTLDLQRASEDIANKNKEQDTAIDALQIFRGEAEVRIKNLEHDIEVLRSHRVAMSELLSGNPSTPGVIARIDENSAKIAAFEAMLDKRFEAIEKHFEELNKPRGLARLINWANKNPLALLAVATIFLLVVH